MNKKEFVTYLHQPQLLDKEAGIALHEVITDFPYFQAAHQLLLKAYHNKDSYHFEKQLPVTSLIHGDRSLLFEYLKQSLVQEFKETVKNDPETLEKVFIENKSAIFTEVKEIQGVSPSHETLPVIETETEVILENKAEPIQEPETEIETEAEIKTETEKIISDDDLPFQNFEKKYLHKEVEIIVHPIIEIKEPIETKAEVEVEVKVKSESESESESEVEDKSESESDLQQIIIASPKVKAEHEYQIDTKKEEAVVVNLDFLGWLTTKTKHLPHEPKPQDTTETNLKTTIENPLNEDLNETGNKGEKRINKFNALIDKFIETSPSISKPQQTRFYNPAEKAKESITESFDLVTETLARIYIKQNNYKKAILVYEKLSLLYPERISYFAVQIENLQSLINK